MTDLGKFLDDCNSAMAAAHLGGIINSVWSPESCESPAVSHVIRKWTGVMGFTADFFPLVGRLPREATGREGDGEWISAGFNGYGMAIAWLCGKHVADKIFKRPDDRVLPEVYVVSAERLALMKCEDAIKHWMEAMGID